MQENLNNPAYYDKNQCCWLQITWTAVFSGALVAIGLSFLFGLFGTSIGLSAFSTPATGNKTFLIGGYLGMLILTIFSMGLAGWIAGFLAKPKCGSHNMGSLYGFIAWCVALVLLILLSSSSGQFIAHSIAALTNSPMSIANISSQAVSAISNAADQPIEAFALGTFLTFLLFFIGALSSCLGGHWGFYSGAKCNNKGL